MANNMKKLQEVLSTMVKDKESRREEEREGRKGNEKKKKLELEQETAGAKRKSRSPSIRSRESTIASVEYDAGSEPNRTREEKVGARERGEGRKGKDMMRGDGSHEDPYVRTIAITTESHADGPGHQRYRGRRTAYSLHPAHSSPSRV